MKTTKGGKVMNPTDAFRKEQRKKELKRVSVPRPTLGFPRDARWLGAGALFGPQSRWRRWWFDSLGFVSGRLGL